MEGKVFGVPLEELMARQASRRPQLRVPYVVEALSRAVVCNVHEEGLFRLSPASTALTAMEAAIDTGGEDALDKVLDPHVAAALLKVFLRRLPQPILLSEYYADWLALGELEKGEMAGAVRAMVRRLPALNRDVLERVAFTARQVANNEVVNRVNPKAVSICIAPSLLWREAEAPRGGSPRSSRRQQAQAQAQAAAVPSAAEALRLVAESRNAGAVVVALIEDFDAVFAREPGDEPLARAASMWKVAVTPSEKSLVGMAVHTAPGSAYAVWVVDSDGALFQFDTQTGDLENTLFTR
eukprot:m51a1_g12593 hypothetical protein (296) ;mRNA; f:2343-3537